MPGLDFTKAYTLDDLRTIKRDLYYAYRDARRMNRDAVHLTQQQVYEVQCLLDYLILQHDSTPTTEAPCEK